jgi:glycosyltransferase involved in cell wall biosynthesis
LDALDLERDVLKCPYLLIIPIPCYVDAAGKVWLERSWNHDLIEHLSYLKEFVLCAPKLTKGQEPDLVQFEIPMGAQFTFQFLPPQSSYLEALLNLPRTAVIVWRAIGRASIVHSGIIGWPYPLGWLANPLAKLRKKRLIIIVESNWLLSRQGRETLMQRFLDMAPLRTWMAKWSCTRADLVLFTQPGYRETLAMNNLDRSYVTPAVWVNEANILKSELAAVIWEKKVLEPVHLLFAGRLTFAKGTDTLLTALNLLERQNVNIRIDVIGSGEDRNKLLGAAAQFRSVSLRVLEPIPYGQPFFDLLKGYHAVVIPSLTDEQPRIVFDANSQAVPVIASDTPGLQPHVDHGKTGYLISKGDHQALARAMFDANSNGHELQRLGLAALSAVQGITHKAMHKQRAELIYRHCIV